jgi:hypothetical protein
MKKTTFNSNFVGIYEKFLKLIRLFLISLSFNYDKKINYKFKLLLIISLLASILIRCNLINEDLIINILLDNNSIFLVLFLFCLIYLSLIYINILIIRLIKRIYYGYKNIYQFIIFYKKGIYNIKVIMSFYYIQNIFFIALSLLIIYNILNKLYFLFNQNINLLIFSLTSIIFMFILSYNFILIIKEFKPINLKLLALNNNNINNKFVLVFCLIIFIELVYIFILPFFLFKLLNYDKLFLFINNLNLFKSNNIKFKPYYMFPHNTDKNNNLIGSDSVSDSDNKKVSIISEIDKITLNNTKSNAKIGNSGNIINFTKSEVYSNSNNLLTPKASTSNLTDISGNVINFSKSGVYSNNLLTPKSSTSKLNDINFTKSGVYSNNLLTPKSSTSNLNDINFSKYGVYSNNLLTPKSSTSNLTDISSNVSYINNLLIPKASTSNLNEDTNVPYIYSEDENNLFLGKELIREKKSIKRRRYLDLINDDLDFTDLFTTTETIKRDKEELRLLKKGKAKSVNDLPEIIVTNIDKNKKTTLLKNNNFDHIDFDSDTESENSLSSIVESKIAPQGYENETLFNNNILNNSNNNLPSIVVTNTDNNNNENENVNVNVNETLFNKNILNNSNNSLSSMIVTKLEKYKHQNKKLFKKSILFIKSKFNK